MTGGPRNFESISASSEGYFEIRLDTHEQIAAILYCGTRRIDMARLACIMGLPAAYLDDVKAKTEAGEVTDMLEFIGGPWASALFHDKFPTFRAQMLDMVISTDKVDELGFATDVAGMVQDAVIDFVRTNVAELIAYNIPFAKTK